MNSKKVAIDYKGKHFIIQDHIDEDGFDIEDPFVDVEKIIASDAVLTEHIVACNYYGIPPYLGKDKVLLDKIDKLEKLLANQK